MTILQKFRLFLCLLLPVTALADDLSTANYKLKFSANDPKTIEVEAKISLKNNKIRMASWGHPALPHGWGTFVDELVVKDDKNNLLQATPNTKDGWGAWVVEGEDGLPLTLSYKVSLTQDEYDWNPAGGQDSRPAVTENVIFLVTKALFIYSPGLGQSTVEMNVPENWKISAPWRNKPGAPDTFEVDSWVSLVNNALVVGDHYERVIQDGDMEIVLAVDNALRAHVDLFQEVFQSQLSNFRKVYDATPKVKYLVTLRGANEDDGESFNNSFNQVIIAENLERRKIVWANTMSHELFHYWNGDHSKRSEDTYWFTEGFTEYYSSLTLFRTGIIEESLYFKKVERYLSRYHITMNMNPEEAVSLVQAGHQKHKNWLQVYGGGATLALVLDLNIRHATQGKKSLDDVMRLLNQRFKLQGLQFEIKNIAQIVSEVSGKDYQPFFKDHVLATGHKLDLAKALSFAGLELAQFTDEFYIIKTPLPTENQQSIYQGWTSDL
ncbi:hypothetical protein [Planctobacterium marinum]|uniref:Peptidase M61 catalytic domain-containing protein n=1 Tax=Planctobacterium marinum TaxID=1631968 RepID=A0AA48HST5_9ALTE|nr:hypothetical protein MACH26_35880 [Planctobacterium marinum]